MVDRTIGKLDEIALSIKSGSNISSHAEDRQILREAFYAVIEKTRDTQKPLVIARQPEVPFSAEPQVTPKRPVSWLMLNQRTYPSVRLSRYLLNQRRYLNVQTSRSVVTPRR